MDIHFNSKFKFFTGKRWSIRDLKVYLKRFWNFIGKKSPISSPCLLLKKCSKRLFCKAY